MRELTNSDTVQAIMYISGFCFSDSSDKPMDKNSLKKLAGLE